MMGNILIVDDNVIVAIDLEAEVNALGMSAVIACEPAIAIGLVRAMPFVAAFIDVTLRDPFDGLDVARVVARDTRAQIVIITAHSPAELVGRMEGIGDPIILSKPIDYGEMRPLLRSMAARQTPPAERNRA
jgi:two-component system OmpR family response regulator